MTIGAPRPWGAKHGFYCEGSGNSLQNERSVMSCKKAAETTVRECKITSVIGYSRCKIATYDEPFARVPSTKWL